jgi:hypothetical protein
MHKKVKSGYTDGGAPYGLTYEEMKKMTIIEYSMNMKEMSCQLLF